MFDMYYSGPFTNYKIETDYIPHTYPYETQYNEKKKSNEDWLLQEQRKQLEYMEQKVTKELAKLKDKIETYNKKNGKQGKPKPIEQKKPQSVKVSRKSTKQHKETISVEKINEYIRKYIKENIGVEYVKGRKRIGSVERNIVSIELTDHGERIAQSKQAMVMPPVL